MTDKELIQALRWCAAGHACGCIGCPGESACDEAVGKVISDAADRLEQFTGDGECERKLPEVE